MDGSGKLFSLVSQETPEIKLTEMNKRYGIMNAVPDSIEISVAPESNSSASSCTSCFAVILARDEKSGRRHYLLM
jgi:hypothetical protein